jgi:hypothetical protein
MKTRYQPILNQEMHRRHRPVVNWQVELDLLRGRISSVDRVMVHPVDLYTVETRKAGPSFGSRNIQHPNVVARARVDFLDQFRTVLAGAWIQPAMIGPNSAASIAAEPKPSRSVS